MVQISLRQAFLQKVHDAHLGIVKSNIAWPDTNVLA